MTTTTTAAPSPWGKPGGWALDAEKQEEEEELQQQQQPDFPSLSAAAVTKTKKKKPQTLSLAEFTTGKSVTHGSSSAFNNKGLTTGELSNLPTGPRERSADEIQNFRTGGFKSYTNSNSNNNNREASSSRWGNSLNKDRDDRRDNNGGGFPSRADETDDWTAAKKSVPPRDNRPSGRAFFDSHSKSNNNNSSSTWGNKRVVEGEQASGGRPRLVLQPRSLPVPVSNGDQPQPVTKTKTNPFGAARPREQVLADKGQDWKEIDHKLESHTVTSATTWRKPDPHTPS